MAANLFNTEWLCGGEKFFPAMLAAITQAQQTVELEIYIYAGDEVGRRFLEALTQSAKRGV